VCKYHKYGYIQRNRQEGAYGSQFNENKYIKLDSYAGFYSRFLVTYNWKGESLSATSPRIGWSTFNRFAGSKKVYLPVDVTNVRVQMQRSTTGSTWVDTCPSFIPNDLPTCYRIFGSGILGDITCEGVNC
jgi:hypothetical protein